jgi:hypothetical protein
MSNLKMMDSESPVNVVAESPDIVASFRQQSVAANSSLYHPLSVMDKPWVCLLGHIQSDDRV